MQKVADIYLPIVTANPKFSGYLGLQVDASISGYENFIIPNRVYQSPLRWDEIERTKGTYIFPKWLDHNVETFRSVGTDFILGTKTCPAWARLWSSKLGSPPKPECYIKYINFLSVVIDRYQPKAIAIWNEPDVSNTIGNDLQYWFGAWVDNNNFRDAGYRYGDLCAEVYYELGGENTLFFAGELIGAETSLEFISSAISSGLYADYITFHKYIYNENQFHEPFDFANKIRNLTSIPMIITETNLISDDGDEQLKAEFVEYIRDKIGWEGLDLIEFYSLYNVWRNTQFIQNGIPTYAYNVWKDL